jgi:hypothetical protein
MNETEEIERLRARVVHLETVLNQKSPAMVAKLNLTPALSDLLGLLISLPFVTAHNVQDQLAIFTNLKVGICRLRKILQPHGVEIKSRRFAGYWLSEKDKEYLRTLLTDEVSEAA